MRNMDESKRTPRAVFWSALLHVGLAGFLFATTLSCTRWEHLIEVLHLPDSWNPVTCMQPVSQRGPVIEATLVGAAGAPLPPPVKTKVSKPSVAPPKASKQVIPQEKPKLEPIKTLAAPPKHPDTRDQKKVVAKAQKKAEQAKHEQEQKQKQHMAELEAAQQAKLDEIFKQMDQAKAQREHVEQNNREDAKKLAQMKDKAQAQSKAPPQDNDVAPATKARTGSGGTAEAAYQTAVQNAVTQAWIRPNNIPDGSVCPIHIVQIPGGQVISVTIQTSCPFDAAARRSVKNAVLRAQPLPYKGFEKQFQTDLTLNFKVND